jgi:RimJ/RimL family protein N-acetyltransferase
MGSPVITTAKGEIKIQAAGIENAAEIFDLRLEALRTNPEAFAADFELTLVRGEKEWQDIIRGYAENLSGIISIACKEDRVIGMGAILRGHWPKTRHCGTLWGIYITPEFRGQKIGEAIVKHCIEWATGNQISVITLAVVTSNTAAIRCYQACGFVEYGTAPRALLYNKSFYDELLMYRFT